MSEFLTGFQKQVLKEIGESELSDYFVWSGGTALSSQYLKHRKSEDLDFFSKELVPEDYLLIQVKKFTGDLEIDQLEQQRKFNRHQFWLNENGSQLKIEFVFYPFPFIEKPTSLEEFSLDLDSVKDILTNKTHAVFERSEPKDAFDIYCILKEEEIELSSPVEWVERKFEVEIDPVILVSKILEGVSDLSKIEPLVVKQSLFKPKRIGEYFEKQARESLRKHLG